ncbi:MAG TPA: endonuclease/exonuclease/phosphatase family protein, partial [Spirochaetia bacterium]|nr:endonuclease/exonuclease/phosphatase family protein [Spirochaetia bacterium]
MKKSRIMGLIVPLILLCACALACRGNEISVLSYNVENLFDGTKDGTEYREFDPLLGVWTEAYYRAKLSHIGAAIRFSYDGGPDIVLLQEIENSRVLEDLAERELAGLGYRYRTAPDGSGAATTIGVLSRLPITRTAVYMLPPWKESPLRPVLEIHIETGEDSLIIFNNHWKSKSGGAAATEEARKEAARVVGARVRELQKTAPGTPVIVAGDLNEQPHEYMDVGQAYQTALLPEGVTVPDIDPENSLFLTGTLAAAGASGDRLVFFDPWAVANPASGTTAGESPPAPTGSYYYRGAWERIDHILYLPGRSDYHFKEFQAVADPRLRDQESGAPLS